MKVVYGSPEILRVTGTKHVTSPYYPEAQALFDRIDTELSDDRKGAINKLIAQWVDFGVFNKLDLVWIAGLDEQMSTRNWIKDEFNATLHGTVDFVADRGFKGNNLDFYMDTHIVPGAPGVKYQKDSAFFGSAIQDFLTGNQPRFLGGLYGGPTAAQVGIFHNNTGFGNLGYSCNTGLVTGASGTLRAAHWYVSRVEEGQFKIFREQSVYGTHNTLSRDFTPGNATIIFHGRRRLDLGTIEVGNVIRQSAYVVGSGLTEADVKNFYYPLNEYLAYIGAEARIYRPEVTASIEIAESNVGVNTDIHYTLRVEDGVVVEGTTVDIEVEGDLSDNDFDLPFVTALQNVAGPQGGVSFDGIKTITLQSSFSGILTWTRKHTTTQVVGSKHTVRIGNSSMRIDVPVAMTFVGQPTLPPMVSTLKGYNLSGMEFANYAFYPNQADVDYYFDQGYNAVRVPFLWERLQHNIFGPLDTVGNNPVEGLGDAANCKAVIDRALAKGQYVILDPHNFGKRPVNGVDRSLGDPQLPITALMDFIVKFHEYLGNHPKLIWCLMNEPVNVNPVTWRKHCKALTDHFRSKGFLNQVQVPGWGFTGAHDWVSSGNAARYINFKDPANNWVLEMHQYLDSGNAGQLTACSVNAWQRLQAATASARANGQKIFLGEFGAGANFPGGEQCLIELPAMIDYMVANKDVWQGGAPWGTNKFWGVGYPIRVEPTNRLDFPSTMEEILRDHFLIDWA